MTYNRPRDSYFETQILTAAPQKLQLMLLDGALRFARQAGDHWSAGRIREGGEAIIGAQRILTELLRALKPDLAPALVSQVSSLYNFIFRRLVEAGFRRDQQKLAEAIGILETERETWRQLCEQLGEKLESRAPVPQSAPAPRAPIAPHLDLGRSAVGSFSLEA
jgi:flagellar secretion chaperone FliS